MIYIKPLSAVRRPTFVVDLLFIVNILSCRFCVFCYSCNTLIKKLRRVILQGGFIPQKLFKGYTMTDVSDDNLRKIIREIPKQHEHLRYRYILGYASVLLKEYSDQKELITEEILKLTKLCSKNTLLSDRAKYSDEVVSYIYPY